MDRNELADGGCCESNGFSEFAATELPELSSNDLLESLAVESSEPLAPALIELREPTSSNLSEPPFAVSVIVPFYNAAETLPACLASLKAQTLDSLELVLVDDGSQDDGLRIAQEFASEFAADRAGSCVVLSQQNAGPSAARNRGLDVVHGAYVAFADADDTVDSGTYRKMYESALRYDSDLVTCGRMMLDAKTGRLMKKQVPGYDVLSGGLAQCPDIAKRVGTLMCDKLFRRSIIEEHGLRLDESVRHAEDYLFNSEFRLHVNTVSTVREPLYVYLSNEGSLSRANVHAMDIPRVCERVVEMYRQAGVLESCSQQLLYVLVGFYLRKCKALDKRGGSGKRDVRDKGEAPATPHAPSWQEFKQAFLPIFRRDFSSSWRLMVIKRAIRMEGWLKSIPFIVKALG